VRATWLARLPAERAAGSSTFHLRLQRKHAGGYDHLRRAEYKRLCEAGRAAALGNLARVLIGLRRIDEAVAQLDEAVALRRAGFGGREAGVGALLDLRAAAARAGGRIDEAGRLAAAARVVEADPVRYDAARLERETGPRFDDPWRLRAALYLSPIPPALRPRA
jgi:tetratricopeptide (TPR) repeat protein